MRKAAFLDRDGVINIDHAYVSRREDFEWVEGVLDAARKLYEAGYALVVVTNQSGIGRGYYTETDFEALNVYMCRMFEEAGAPLAGIYFCPHHPEKAIGAYKIAVPAASLSRHDFAGCRRDVHRLVSKHSIRRQGKRYAGCSGCRHSPPHSAWQRRT